MRIFSGGPICGRARARMAKVKAARANVAEAIARSPETRAGVFASADNMFTFKRARRLYVGHIKDRTNGFESVTLPIGHGMEYLVRLA
jgi:hypothetical protein